MNAAEIYLAAIRLDAELAAGEEAALRLVLAGYAGAKERMRQRLSELLRVRHQRERSPDNSVYARWEEQRLTELLGQVETEITGLLRQVGDTIIAQQGAAIEASLTHVQELARMQSPGLPWNRLPRQVFQAEIGFLGDGSPLAALLAKIAGGSVSKAREVLLDAALRGWGARKTAKALFGVTDASVGRALLIARTETARVYREASHGSFEANADVLDGWMWCASFDKRTCAGCLAKHGSIHPVSERLMDHPAGRCVAVPMTHDSPLLEGIPSADAWLKRLKERDQVLILGSQHARDAWASGEVELSEFAGVRRSRAWGESIYRRSLSEIRGNK